MKSGTIVKKVKDMNTFFQLCRQFSTRYRTKENVVFISLYVNQNSLQRLLIMYTISSDPTKFHVSLRIIRNAATRFYFSQTSISFCRVKKTDEKGFTAQHTFYKYKYWLSQNSTFTPLSRLLPELLGDAGSYGRLLVKCYIKS